MLAFRGATDTYVKSSVHCSGEQDTRRGSVGARLWDRCRCQYQAEAWVQSCDGDAPVPARLYHQRAPAPGRRCLPAPSSAAGAATAHSTIPTSPGPSRWHFPHVLTSGAFVPLWRVSPAPWSASALKPLQSPSRPTTEPEAHLQRVSQMIWTLGLLHNPLSIPVSQ